MELTKPSGRVRLRLNGCRKPSPGQERAGSWPFGLPSSRLRPFRAARSACSVKYGTGDFPWPTSRSDLKPSGLAAGRCSNSRLRSALGSGNRPAVAHRPGKQHARPVDNCTARSGLCWASLAGRFFVRELLQRKSCLRRPRATPLEPQMEGRKKPARGPVAGGLTFKICGRLRKSPCSYPPSRQTTRLARG